MNELPKGWTISNLKALVGVNGVFTDGDWILSEHLRTGNDVRLIQLADIGITRFLNKSQKFISQETADELGVTYLSEGDVLISRMAHPLARACVFPHQNQPCITAVDVSVARCDRKVCLPEFLMYLCNSQRVLEQAESVAVGTTRKRISRKNLEAITIPLPPLKEQRRIVAKLEKLLSKVEACQKRLEKIPTILKRFRQSVLAAACSGRLTADWRETSSNGEREAQHLLNLILEKRHKRWEVEYFEIKGESGNKRRQKENGKEQYKSPTLPDLSDELDIPNSWVIASLDQLTSNITSGSRDWSKYYGEGNGTFIMAQNVRPGFLDLSYRQPVNPPENDRDRIRSEVKQGDLLVTIVGANTGDVCPVLEPLTEHYVCQSVALLRPVLPESTHFLNLYFMSVENGQKQFSRYIYGQGRPHLSFNQLRMTPVFLPPVEEQQEIVRRVEELFKYADQIEARYNKAKDYVDKLTQSILAKAFRGELVPQDPADEPASVLLERIRAERQLQNQETTDRKKSKRAVQEKRRTQKDRNTEQLELISRT